MPPGISYRTELREPTPEDAEAIGRMHWAAWREAYGSLLPAGFWDGEGEQRRVELWRWNLTSPDANGSARIAVRNGAVVGLVLSGPSQANETAPPARDRELWALYVLASEYGTGLAARLLDAALGDEPAQLWVFEANPRARAFYSSHGFVADGARHVFGPEFGNQPEIRMVR